MIEPNDSNFRLTDQEAKEAARDMTTKALYVLLGAIVLITAGHGIMLVLLTSDALAFAGLTGIILNVIRVAFPVVTEWGAVVAGLGFINAKWRKGQKTVALLIEIVWVVFAAANMITVFAIERNQQLQGWQNSWISYGLPMSALIQAILVYSLKRTDPDAKRLNEEAAAMEEVKMIRFSAKRDVAISPQMKAIEKQKQWLEFVTHLRTLGYTEAQIRFILADTPQLLIDGNRNGTPDLLEAGDSSSPAIATKKQHNAPRQDNGVPDYEDTIRAQPPQRMASESPNVHRPDLSRTHRAE